MKLFKLAIAATLAVGAFLAPATATEANRDDRPILTITGKVKDGAPRDFTRADLEKLGLVKIVTKTPWHNGPQVFEGVPLAKLMEQVGAKGEKVHVVALNKYRTEIPAADFAEHQPILALKLGGDYMAVRDKGPLFIMYPFDDKPQLRSELYFSRAAWQVRSIAVE